MIGELYKVNVLPFKLIKLCLSTLLENYAKTYLKPYQLEKPPIQEGEDEDEDKYPTNDYIEALIEFIENVGKEIEEYEAKKEMTENTDSHRDTLK